MGNKDGKWKYMKFYESKPKLFQFPYLTFKKENYYYYYLRKEKGRKNRKEKRRG